MEIKKTDEKRTETIINIAIQISATLSFLCEPFLPYTSQKLKKLLNIDNGNWDTIHHDIIKENHKIKPHEHLFRKIEDQEIEYQLNKLNN